MLFWMNRAGWTYPVFWHANASNFPVFLDLRPTFWCHEDSQDLGNNIYERLECFYNILRIFLCSFSSLLVLGSIAPWWSAVWRCLTLVLFLFRDAFLHSYRPQPHSPHVSRRLAIRPSSEEHDTPKLERGVKKKATDRWNRNILGRYWLVSVANWARFRKVLIFWTAQKKSKQKSAGQAEKSHVHRTELE